MIVSTRYLTPNVFSGRLSAHIIHGNICALPFPPQKHNTPNPILHGQD